MAYVPGDLVPRGSLGSSDELGKISLKKIGRTIKKAAKDTGRAVVKVAKVAAPIAVPIVAGGAVAFGAKKAVGALQNRRKANTARTAARAAAPSVLIRAAETPATPAAPADAIATTGVASGRNRTRRDPRDTRTPVERVAGNVMRATSRTRAEVDKRQQQTRDAARRARQIAEIAQGTPAAAAANRAAEVVEQIANRQQVVTDTVRSTAAGVDGAIVGAGSAVAAEEAQQGVGAFFRSRQGLYVIGAGLAAAVLLSSRRK